MFYSLRGKLIHIESGIAVVECGGVGYKCQTTVGTQRDIKLDAEVTLYTHLSVREDSIDLYGFYSMSELSTFKMLICIKGVGPKAGLAILSVLSPEQLALAVASGDAKSISRAQGVGNKIAQRIILELKDKFKNLTVQNSPQAAQLQSPSAGNYAKAMEALSVLGCEASEISPILYTLDPEQPVEKLIGETLNKLGRKI